MTQSPCSLARDDREGYSALRQHADRKMKEFELTVQEKIVALYVLGGYSTKFIAAKTNTTDKTIKTHLGSIYDKCFLPSCSEKRGRTGLCAVLLGWTDEDSFTT